MNNNKQVEHLLCLTVTAMYSRRGRRQKEKIAQLWFIILLCISLIIKVLYNVAYTIPVFLQLGDVKFDFYLYVHVYPLLLMIIIIYNISS